MIDSQNFMQAKAYHDLQGLESLKKNSAKSDDPAALKEAAKHFEAFFLQMILKSAREANYQINGEEGIFNSEQMKFYQNMLDEQMSVEISLNANGGKGLGIAEILTEQLAKKGDLQNNLDGKTKEKTKEKTDLANLAENKVNTKLSLKPRPVSFANVEMPEELRVVSLKQTVKYSPNTYKTPSSNLDAHAKRVEKNVKENKNFAVNLNVEKREDFKNPLDFIEKIYPIAKKIGSSFGLDPKILLAQSALETGWGKFVIQGGKGESSHNLFGIKADSRWRGESAKARTLEFVAGKPRQEIADFRSYASFEQSMEDYVSFLKSNPRYKKALENKDDPQAFTGHLQKAGYATDPKYAAKIMNIMDTEYFKNLDNLRF